MTVKDFMKRYDGIQFNDDELYKRDHSLQALAKHRAAQPGGMRVGTAFDWEDFHDYQKELARLDREGAARSGN